MQIEQVNQLTGDILEDNVSLLEGTLSRERVRSKPIVSKSSAELEYRVMTDLTSEFVWIHDILIEMVFCRRH